MKPVKVLRKLLKRGTWLALVGGGLLLVMGIYVFGTEGGKGLRGPFKSAAPMSAPAPEPASAAEPAPSMEAEMKMRASTFDEGAPVRGVPVAMEDSAGRSAALPTVAQLNPAGYFDGRKIIRNAEVSVEVTDLDKALSRVSEIVWRAGGVITDSWASGEAYTEGTVKESRLTLRIPADRYDQVIPQLRELGRIASERSFTQDVTEEYVDIEARMKSLEEQERRLQALFGRANTIEEIMRVENELTRVRAEIDSLKGRQRYLDDRVDFSMIQLQLRQTPLAAKQVTPPGWQGMWQRAADAFIVVSNGLLAMAASLVVFVAGLIPVLLVFTPIGALVWYVARSRRRAGPPSPPFPPAPPGA